MRLAWVMGVVLCGAFAACVGSDPASSPSGTPAQGDHRGPCFPNNTCNAGLECHDGVCLEPGEPPPPGAGDDGSTKPDTSGGDDASGDGNTDDVQKCTVPAPTGDQTEVLCSVTDKCGVGSSLPFCCSSNYKCVAQPSDCTGVGGEQPVLQCTNSLNCNAGAGVCCGNFKLTKPDLCPVRGALTKSACGTVECSNGDSHLCNGPTDSRCPAGTTCQPVQIDDGIGNLYMLAACMKP
jgi:hypothetical protein